MKEKEILYEVKIALKGRLYDTVKIQAQSLDSIPKKHKILSYKIINNKK